FLINRHYTGYDSVFNMFGDRDPVVYIRFPDDNIVEVTTAYAYSELESGRESDYAIIFDEQLLYLVLSAPDDLRIRFEGSKGREDFTLPHPLIRAIAA